MTFTFESTGLDQSVVAVLDPATNPHADAAESALQIYDDNDSNHDGQEAACDEQESGELLAGPENQTECVATDSPPATVHAPEVPASTKEKEKTGAARAAEHADQLHQIRRKEGEVASASVRWARLQAQTKRAKKYFDLIVEELSDLQDELGGDWADEEVDGDPVDTPVDQPLVVFETSVESPQPPNTSTAWRDVPTTEINLTGIRGLGEKKLDELIAICPTIGALEDMRASFGGLRNLKGIGEKTSDEIENRIIDWLSKNRDAAVFDAAVFGSEVVTKAADPPSITFNDSGNDVTASPVDLSDL